MPALDLPDAEMESLITFVLGQFSPTLPVAYYTSDALQEFKSRQSLHTGREAYSLICSGCHGSDGEGKDYEGYATGAPSIGNIDFQAVASRDFIEFAVWAGRGTSRMESWAPVLSGLRTHELDLIIDYVRGLRLEGPSYQEVAQAGGSLRQGEESFAHNCAMCHGQVGEGGAGPSLNSQEFLSIASDEFLSTTIVTGRSNTAMPSWSALPPPEIASIR
jgi:mono/diheme cytochrome c family protein